MKSIVDKHSSITSPVTDADLFLHILSGLGSEYVSVVTSTTTCQDTISFGDLNSMLLCHETNLEKHNTPQISVNTTTKSIDSRDNPRNNGRNNNHNNRFHGNNSNNNRPRIKCQVFLRSQLEHGP